MFKKIVAIVLAMAMILALAACGNSQSNAGNNTSNAPEVYEITFASNHTGGTFYEWAVAVGEIINK